MNEETRKKKKKIRVVDRLPSNQSDSMFERDKDGTVDVPNDADKAYAKLVKSHHRW